MVWCPRIVVPIALLLFACAEDPGRRPGNLFGEDDQVSTEGEGSGEPWLDLGSDDGTLDSGCSPDSRDATISGIVLAPNLEIPVAGALVWASKTRPEGIPANVYCAECFDLECETNPWTTSRANGHFELALDSGTWWIGVQKGQFLRLTEITVGPGSNPLGDGVTSLPDRNEPDEGRYIPKIALALGAYDRLEDGLAKLGLGDSLIDTSEHRQTLIPGTEQFHVWDNAGEATDLDVVGEFGELLGDLALLEQYHIVFVPCSNDFALAHLDADARANLREWVARGGKLYVSDWSNEFIGQPFGQYQEFWQQGGDADLPDNYDSTGVVLDASLLAWLDALPPGLKDINAQNDAVDFPAINDLPLIETVNNWSGVQATPAVMVDDGMGGQVDVGHKVWVEGPGDQTVIAQGQWPLTISAEYGCGKLMFTTYHTAEGSDAYIGLTPQELVLLYLILEIGTCQTPYQPPPPVG